MTIAGITDAALTQPAKAVGSKDLNRSDFMTLFITQLQYQDPMQPMDSYEMASQLAQFSNMEATMKMSDNMEKLLEYQTSQNNLEMLALLDSKVQVSGNMIGVVDGVATATEYVLTDRAESLKVEIYDSADHLIWQKELGSLAAGTYELEWDGTNLAGDQVEDGPYGYVVKALNLDGSQIEVDYRTTGKVTGINFEGGAAKLRLDGYVEVGVDEVIKVQ